MRPSRACSRWSSADWQREPLGSFDLDAHHELAREAAAASAVLLKNEQNLLPLDPEQGGPVAVIGEFARTPRYQGAGSSQVNPTRLENALDSLRSELAGKREVLFAPAFEIDAEQPDPQLFAEAVQAAGGCGGRARVPRAAAVVRVGGLGSRAHGSARAPARPARADRRRQPERGGRALQRLRRGDLRLGPARPRAARGLAARAGGRSCDRRPAARARLAVGQARRDDPAEVHRQPHGRELPGRGPRRPLRRGTADRLPLVRRP